MNSVRSGSDMLFRLTMLITIGHALFILWDFITMMPFVKIFLGIEENTVYSTGSISILYLALLGAYTGHKEIRRWAILSDDALHEMLERKHIRGEFIVSSWVIFCFVALAFKQLHIIPRMPQELFRTTLQVIGVIFGTYTSKGLYLNSKKRKLLEDESTLSEELWKEKIIEYVQQHGKIDNETCQQILNADRHRSYRILAKLVNEGKLIQEGEGRNASYRFR